MTGKMHVTNFRVVKSVNGEKFQYKKILDRISILGKIPHDSPAPLRLCCSLHLCDSHSIPLISHRRPHSRHLGEFSSQVFVLRCLHQQPLYRTAATKESDHVDRIQTFAGSPSITLSFPSSSTKARVQDTMLSSTP